MNINIKLMPISIGGVILGLTAMGNLFYDYFMYSREICDLISTFLFILVLIKLVKYPETFKEDLNNPILASIIATLSMTLMLYSNYLYFYMGSYSMLLWVIAIMLHIFFVINYIVKFFNKLDISDFTAGSFVVFAGIQMIAITAPTFNQEFIGTICFWISFILVVLVFLIVTYRYIKIPVNNQTKPIIGVYAAPFSLCSVGYLSSVAPNNLIMVVGFYIMTKILYIIVLEKFIEYRHFPFYPTYAAYTFPIVINTITTLKTIKFLKNNGINLWFMQYELMIEMIIAILLVTYILIQFLMNIFELRKKID